MEKEKTGIWASQILISFCLAGTTHAFLGPLPKSSVKPNKLKGFFTSVPYCKPQTFQDTYFELGFMEQPHLIFHSSPSIHSEPYIIWINRIEKEK